MADTSDYIPANGIRFDKALERLFDTDPRAAELRSRLDRLIEAYVSSGSEYDDAIEKWGTVRRDVDLFFRTELRNGSLNAYQRDPYTGADLRVSTKDWDDAPDAPAENMTFFNVGLFNSRLSALQERVNQLEKELAEAKGRK